MKVNIDYILMLVKMYHDSNCTDKEILSMWKRLSDLVPSSAAKRN